MLVRFAKRRTAWEPNVTLTELLEVEFKQKNGQVDLCPSTYRIDPHQLVQAYAEHAASAPISPPSSPPALGIDAQNTLFRATPCAGKSRFAFTRDAHHEVILGDRADLERFVELLRAEASSRCHAIAKADVLAYVRGRLAAVDPEWQQVADDGRPDWVHKCRKGLTQQ